MKDPVIDQRSAQTPKVFTKLFFCCSGSSWAAINAGWNWNWLSNQYGKSQPITDFNIYYRRFNTRHWRWWMIISRLTREMRQQTYLPNSVYLTKSDSAGYFGNVWVINAVSELKTYWPLALIIKYVQEKKNEHITATGKSIQVEIEAAIKALQREQLRLLTKAYFRLEIHCGLHKKYGRKERKGWGGWKKSL